ncbi:MAG: UDP-2,3-diacylglucosamine diphosphatase LpxI [Verrucomicrobiota bacterium]
MDPTHSRFLPEGFRPEAIGLIAGKGRYPILTAEQIRQSGVPFKLIAFEGETDPDLIESFAPEDRKIIKVGQLGKMLKALDSMSCRYALMAGQITPKRLFKGLHPDLKTLKILNSLRVKNAETIFGAISQEIEAIGLEMLDARAFLDQHLASEGLMTKGRLKAPVENIEHGIRIAKGAADLDIGQGAVVRKGTVLAVEAYEGTDPMLKRAGSFKTDGLIFVKTVKRQQDYRFDVPVFGQRTLEVMNEAKIQTAVLEADKVLMLDKEQLLEQAKQLKIELFGFISDQRADC